LPPTIGQLRALTNLWIFDNPDLRELPISLGDIPGITDLVIRGTRISSSIAASILGSCQAKRSRHNADMLPSRLNLWKRISGNEFDLRPILDLEDVDKVNVSEWLLRLSHTSDFGSGAQKELAEKACAMLIAVRDYPEFKDFFLGQIDANNRDCEDRAAQAFNELYVAYRIFTMNQDDPLINKLKLIQGCAKTLQLREAIRERIQAHENVGNPEVSEDVEIYLYYETKLRRELGLVTAIQSMRFERIGKRNWINEDELKRNVLENHLNLMSGMEVLRKIAFKDADLEARKRAVDEDFAGRLDALSAKELLGLEFKEQVDDIQTGQEQAITEILVAWVKKELAKG
jgi:hypothetical protein